MLSLPLEFFNGWLFKIDASRYNGVRREKIIQYQKECYSVLFRHFFGQPRETYLALQRMDEKIAKLELMLSADMPVEIFHYKRNIVRMFPPSSYC